MCSTHSRLHQQDVPVANDGIFTGYGMGENRLIQVGHAFVDRSCEDNKGHSVSEMLVTSILDSIDNRHFPVRCLLLLATADWCRQSPSIAQEIRQEFSNRLGCSIPLAGGSMARLYSSAYPGVFVKHGIVLVSLGSQDLRVTVGCLTEPHSKSDAQRKETLAKLAERLKSDVRIPLGMSAPRHLLGFFPGMIPDGHGGRQYLDFELHQEVLDTFGSTYPLFGASTADELTPTVGFQFANDECLTSGLALALVETDLSWGGTVCHGLQPALDTTVSVDTLEADAMSGYVVERLNGQPASQCLAKIPCHGKVEYQKVLLGLPHGSDFDIIQILEMPAGRAGSVRFGRKVRRGSQLYVLDATPQQMVASTTQALESVMKGAQFSREDLRLILAFCCTGRFKHFLAKEYKWEDVVKQFHGQYLGIQVVAGLCAGEFGVDPWHEPRGNSISVSLSYVANAHIPYAKPRELQRHLLEYEHRLIKCKTPREVKSIAMEGVLHAGNVGGQICVVDSQLGRIVNKGLGHFAQVTPLVQDWEAVAALTDRPAPPTLRTLPSNLEDYALAVTSEDAMSGAIVAYSASAQCEEDILTLVVGCLHAIYVVDSTDPKFHCDPHATAQGRIIKQIVVPLVGSTGKAIATMQIGLPDRYALDQESFVLWVSYAQAVASAFERTQEREEREIAQQIFDLSERIIHEPAVDVAPTYWCQTFLKSVVNLLGADGAHMRVFHRILDGEEYHLVAAVGHNADLLHDTRKVTTASDGGCNRTLLEEGGRVTNTREDTTELNTGVKALRDTKYAKELQRSLALIECTALLPLQDQKDVFGSFVVDSKRRYFFTERWERIARAAARCAGAILRVKRADYENRQIDSEQDEMLNALKAARNEDAEEQLQKLIERLCYVVQADLASLYLWHEAAQKLILYKGYNWYKNKEGEASYEKNQGWTGSVPWMDDDISIVRPGAKTQAMCTKTYYAFMVSPAHRATKGESDARIGIRLVTDTDKPVGVLVFSYYKKNTNRLVDEDSRIAKFLRSVAHTITLHVQAAIQRAAERQTERLNETESKVFTLLIDASKSGNWADALKTIRTGFEVDHVVFLRLGDDGYLEHSDLASHPDRPYVARPQRIAPPDFLGPVIYRKQSVLICDPKVLSPRKWPYQGKTVTLCALPVLCTEGAVAGILAFINRQPSRDHPYRHFNRIELTEAFSVAKTLGAAVDHYEHEKKATEEREARLSLATRIGAVSLGSACVLHKLLTPFARIQATLDWLRRHSRCGWDAMNARLSQIEENCQEAVRDIYDAASCDTSIPGNYEVRRAVKEALRVTQVDKQRHIDLTVDNELRHRVRIDLYSMTSALSNLIMNALDAMPTGGRLRIGTHLSSDATRVVIDIYNSGPSYTREEVEKFFDMKRSRDGHLGLGLTITKQAIEVAGGTLTVSSPKDAGGVLSEVTLPISMSDTHIQLTSTGDV
ncbi:MAG: ATP-binding protein [Phycisphaerales bacterium]